jgi:hypothetical protein
MALSIEDQIDELNELIRFDLDAVGAYTEAIDAIHDPRIRDPLVLYRKDHERHVAELSDVVLRLSGTPATSPNVGGIARKTMTKVAASVGAAGDASVAGAAGSRAAIWRRRAPSAQPHPSTPA